MLRVGGQIFNLDTWSERGGRPQITRVENGGTYLNQIA